MNAALPLPSFDNIRIALQFWLDQQDKWFYFEGAALPTGSIANTEVPNPLRSQTTIDFSRQDETLYYLQTRIIGKIHDVVPFPPSLLLHDATVLTVRLWHQRNLRTSVINKESRPKYGLVFSQITYYEPVDKPETFLESDPRVSAEA
jgi:hypothetical protein